MADHPRPQGVVPEKGGQALRKGGFHALQAAAVHQRHGRRHIHRRLSGGDHFRVRAHGPLPIHDGLCLPDGGLAGGFPLPAHRHDVHGAVSSCQRQHLHPQDVRHLSAPRGVVVGVAGGGRCGQCRQRPGAQFFVRLPLLADAPPVGAHGGEPLPHSGGHKGPPFQSVDLHAPKLRHPVGAGPEHVSGKGALGGAAGAGVGGCQQPQHFFLGHLIETSVFWVNSS